ncbi:MAG: T9SS type A sorting domain-containing protein [Bacteroidia bacterium]
MDLPGFAISPPDFPASDFLDDTTAQNPTLIDISDESLVLYVEVTDAKKNTCIDSVRVYFSQFVITLDDKYAYIQAGESTNLYTSVHGGLPPLTYSWTPAGSLSDSSDVNALASPVVNTTYYLTVTDSIGCQAQDVFYVIVTANGIHDLQGENGINLFPNPVSSHHQLNLVLDGGKTGKLLIMDVLGKAVLQENVYPGTNKIDLAGLVPGTYFYKLMSEDGLEGEGKFIKQ